MEKIQINFEQGKNNLNSQDLTNLINTISDCFGIPESTLKKVFKS